MKYKAILLDLDNTLYDYNATHSIALKETLKTIQIETKISEKELLESYNKNRKIIHNSLHGFAASHSRLFYFQRLVEEFRLGYNRLLGYESIYWNTFLNHIELFEGVEHFFQDFHTKTKICIITDLTAQVQFQKLTRMKLLDKIQFVVTSEEAGKEKPHPYIFHLALNKLNLTKDEVLYIGDDFEKDIIGSSCLGIECIWLNRTEKKFPLPDNCREISEFKQLLGLLKL